MNNDIFDENNSLTNQQPREDIVSFIESRLPMLSGEINQAISAAYSIAGLMATPYARKLQEGDPIDEVLTTAGELEVNPDDAEALREELVGKITALLGYES